MDGVIRLVGLLLVFVACGGGSNVLTGTVSVIEENVDYSDEIEDVCWDSEWFDDCDLDGDDAVSPEQEAAMAKRFVDEVFEPACDRNEVTVGDEVIVTNESGVIVGVGTLDSGVSSATTGLPPSALDVRCSLSFEVPLDGPATFYSISIGGVEGPTFSASELEEMSWNVSLGRS